MPTLLVFCVVILIGLLLIKSFFTNIILADGIALGVIATYYAWKFPIHTAFKIMIGIAVLIIILALSRTSIGFWIIASLMSLAWSALIAELVAELVEFDIVWTVIAAIVGFVISIGLHIAARNSLRSQRVNEAILPLDNTNTESSNYIPSPPTLSEVQELRELAKHVDMLNAWVAMLKDPDDNIHEAIAQEHLDRSLNMPGFNALAFKADYIRQIERLERERNVLEGQ